MSGRIRPSARKKTLHNVKCSALSETDKKCIKEVFEKFEYQKEQIEALIAGQETLQKALAEKNAEVERLKEQDETAEKIIREQGGTILHLKNENSRLMDRNSELSEKGEKAVIAYIAARAEAIKEFAESLKSKSVKSYWNEYEIDRLVKEMVGEAE